MQFEKKYFEGLKAYDESDKKAIPNIVLASLACYMIYKYVVPYGCAILSGFQYGAFIQVKISKYTNQTV